MKLMANEGVPLERAAPGIEGWNGIYVGTSGLDWAQSLLNSVRVTLLRANSVNAFRRL